MGGMFQAAGSFNQTLSNWDLTSLNMASHMLTGCGMDCPNYSSTLIGWANNSNTPDSITLGAHGREYSISGAVARNDLTQGSRHWDIQADFTNNNNCWPLPIELYSFTAKQTDGTVFLNWVALSEINNDYYTVYKSKDGKTWKILDKVQGAGNSTTEQTYCLEDNNPYLGVTYYKLTQTDFDGTTQELGIRMIEVNQIVNDLSAYPNPTFGLITIDGTYNDLNSLQIVNILGTVVTNHVNIVSTSTSQIKLDFSNLSKGTYFIRIDNKAIKVIKN